MKEPIRFGYTKNQWSCIFGLTGYKNEEVTVFKALQIKKQYIYRYGLTAPPHTMPVFSAHDVRRANHSAAADLFNSIERG